MIFSQKTKYGIQTTLYMALEKDKETFSTQQISNELGISYSYLAKIVKELSESNILITVRGKGGGIQLAKEPEKIKLIDILYALEGEDYFETCILGKKVCSTNENCICTNTLRQVQHEIYTFLADSTLEDLSDLDHFANTRLSNKLTYAI